MEATALEGVLVELATLACDDAYARRVDELRTSTNLEMISAAVVLLSEAEDEDVRLAAAHVLGTGIGDHLAARRVEGVAVASGRALGPVAVELGRLRSPDALPTLRALAGHRDAAVREGAAAGLGRLVDLEPAALDALVYLAGDEAPAVRARAIAAMGAADVDEARLRDALAAGLDDEDPEVRFESARHLGERGDPRAIDVVLDLWRLRTDFGPIEPVAIHLADATGDERLRPLVAGLDPAAWSESAHAAAYGRARKRFGI
jgi:HEAT repeat protein